MAIAATAGAAAEEFGAGKFWAGQFGVEYTDRNQGEQLHISYVGMFDKVLKAAGAA